MKLGLVQGNAQVGIGKPPCKVSAGVTPLLDEARATASLIMPACQGVPPRSKPGRVTISVGVHQGITRPDHGLGIKRVGETNAGPKLQVVDVNAGEGDRVRPPWPKAKTSAPGIPSAGLMAVGENPAIRWWASAVSGTVPAQAVADGEFVGHLPGVLHEGSHSRIVQLNTDVRAINGISISITRRKDRRRIAGVGRTQGVVRFGVGKRVPSSAICRWVLRSLVPSTPNLISCFPCTQPTVSPATPQLLLLPAYLSVPGFKGTHPFKAPPLRKSALREVMVQVPDIKWDDIGGLESAKQELIEAVEWPLKYPENFEKFGVKPPKGVLIYGPPGTGKTLLAKAVANESESNFIAIKGPELLSKWVGESEKGVREVFRKARQTAPTVIFFDEIDSIASTRGGSSTDSGVTQRVVNQLLTEIDGMEELTDVAVIAATNRVDILDPALVRPGRFDRHVKVEAPNEVGRLAIFKVHTKKMPLAENVSLKRLAKESDGYVGSDIEAVCREAVMLALRENLEIDTISMKYFKEAMKKVKTEEKVELVQYH